jgi:hypothetical protein
MFDFWMVAPPVKVFDYAFHELMIVASNYVASPSTSRLGTRVRGRFKGLGTNNYHHVCVGTM